MKASRLHSQSVITVFILVEALERLANLMPVFQAMVQTRSMVYQFGWPGCSDRAMAESTSTTSDSNMGLFCGRALR